MSTRDLSDVPVLQSVIILLAILGATWFLFGKGKHSGLDERAAIDAAFLGTKGMNGLNGAGVDLGDAGRDFVQAMKQAVSIPLAGHRGRA